MRYLILQPVNLENILLYFQYFSLKIMYFRYLYFLISAYQLKKLSRFIPNYASDHIMDGWFSAITAVILAI